MSRGDSPYTVGEYWLDKRRDGASPDIWQITTYHAASRSERYRSTRSKSLDVAKGIIDAYFEEQRAKKPQSVENAKVIPALFTYWEERGRNVVSPEQIANSIRCFIGFLMQDVATTDVTVAELNPALFERFRIWRMSKHGYDVPWGGKDYQHSSPGVRGESVQRNLEDIRAALNHQAKNGRIPFAPKVPSLDTRYRSKPRDIVLTIDQLGAMVGYAGQHDQNLHRWLCLLISTAARPEAASQFDPTVQWHGATIDLHPANWHQTKKINPVLPVIPEMMKILEAWKEDGAHRVKSHRRAWNTMRRALGLEANIVPKTIRHTVATLLLLRKVPAEEIETFLGHRVLKRTTAVYAKYDPAYLKKTRLALSKIFREVSAAAQQWSAVHSLSKIGNNRMIVVASEGKKD